MGKVKTTSSVVTATVTPTTGGVKLTLPSLIRQLTVIPIDLSKTLDIKFKTTGSYITIPAGNGYSSGYSDGMISSDIWVKMSDGSGVNVEYWV